jgi:hypothetical protein
MWLSFSLLGLVLVLEGVGVFVLAIAVRSPRIIHVLRCTG